MAKKTIKKIDPIITSTQEFFVPTNISSYINSALDETISQTDVATTSFNEVIDFIKRNNLIIKNNIVCTYLDGSQRIYYK